MKIKTFTFNPFQVNCYIVYDDKGSCFIVDASCIEPGEFEELTSFIESRNLSPVMLVNTHGHFDHITGNSFLSERYNLKIAMHRDDLFLVDNAVGQAGFFGITITKPPVPDVFPENGETIRLNGSGLEARHAPGHSPGSLLLYSAAGNFVISGDVLFAGSIGRTDLPGGDYDTLLNSIRKQLLNLPGNTIVYPGHGPATTIEKERQNNPFLN